ncbi:hypothetical protein LTS08_008829 [Lithohypha guttulata]|nr:hypothetical protein LTS08_008829 [Lithohypha guttulata]
MPTDKARLYVALYVRGGVAKMPDNEDKYHWALLVAPKNEDYEPTGTRYHAKNAPGQSTWIFEEKSTSMNATNMILVRVMIGKINDPQALATKLRQVPIVNNDPGWNCVTWLRSALALIAQDVSLMGTSSLGWEAVKATALKYCEQKAAQGRFNGTSKFDMSKVPTFDLLQGKETTK